MDLEQARKQLQSAGRYLLENQLTWGNAGNLSVRTSPGRYLITASGTELGDLRDDDFVECALTEDAQTRYPRKPSKETPMHRAVYDARPEINAVLHASPFYSTLLACAKQEIPANWFVEDMYYLERVARVPYYHPGSAELGEAVQAKVRDANILLLDNHGVLVYDTSVREALMGLQTLELVCRMMVTAKSAGLDIQGLSPETVADFLNCSGYRPRREWMP